jgi:2'-5' RNA ligase
MKQIFFSPINVQLESLGTFPKINHPRVIWAGIRTGTEELRDVFRQLEPRLRRLGIKPDNKGFSPHLTIARVRSERNKTRLAEMLFELNNYEFGTINAKCLRLKKSDLTPRGPIYSNLREVCGKP